MRVLMAALLLSALLTTVGAPATPASALIVCGPDGCTGTADTIADLRTVITAVVPDAKVKKSLPRRTNQAEKLAPSDPYRAARIVSSIGNDLRPAEERDHHQRWCDRTPGRGQQHRRRARPR
jgi:hypothetical protein